MGKKNIVQKTLSALEEKKCEKFVSDFMTNDEYWHGDNLRKNAVEASYFMLLGNRGPGKSTDTTAYFLKRAWEENNFEFGYVRRYDVDVKDSVVDRYFAHLSDFIYNLTFHEYDCVVCYRHDLFFAKTVDRKRVRGKRIGSVFGLNQSEHYKSLHWDNINDLIVEEIIPESGCYLTCEVDKLQELCSTIFRERAKIAGKCHVYLIGNTLSRNCPYFTEWGLEGVRRMKLGEILKITNHGVDSKGREYDVVIAVEMCVSRAVGSALAIGQRSSSINSCEVWTGKRHACLYWKDMSSKYDMLYDVELVENKFSFLIQLMVNNETGDLVLYVYPNTRSRAASTGRKITNEFSENRLVSRFFDRKIRAEMIMADLLHDGKVYFSDNLTGDDFLSVIDNRRGGL